MKARICGAYGDSPTYYVTRRSIEKRVCHFTAYDAMTKIDDRDFDASDPWQAADKKYIYAYEVLQTIKEATGLDEIFLPDEAGVISFTREQLTGKNCRQILEIIASTVCGVWRASGDNGIRLTLCGTVQGKAFGCLKYSEIDFRGRLPIAAFYCENSETGRLIKHTNGRYGAVLETESPIAACENSNQNNADVMAWDRLQNHQYTAWHCDKALTDGTAYLFTSAPAEIDFDGKILIANQVEITCDSTGVYFSGGSEAVDELEYRSRINRELDQRVKIGKTVGNMLITPDGPKLVNKNKSGAAAASDVSDNSQGVEKYGFNVGKNGFTEYEGDLVSAKVFDSAEKVDENTVVITYPGNVQYKYTKEKSGNTVKFKKERLEAENSE